MTKRVAIYSRYSTDLQRDRSIEDQVTLCREFASRNGWRVVAEFADRAQSGASMIGRDGILALVEAAKRREFDVVVAEHGDRLSRITEELDGIRRRMQFAGIVIHTVNAGVIDETQAAIQGLMGALFLRELANKVRRGLSGVVRDGRSAGGRAYGYRPMPGEPGRLAIVDEEAEVIRRIFREYAEGATPRDIAGRLNEEGVPPPRGTRWNASTINGNAARGHGMIFNEAYAGRIVWNRVRMIKDPDSGRRVSRTNPKIEWQMAEAPELRIVDDATWQAATQSKTERAKIKSHMKRAPAHMLSGLLRCGCCGSGYSIHDRDRTGKSRVRCSAVRESGACTNRRILYLVNVEHAVLSGLSDHLSNPWLIDEYVDAYNAERRRLSQTGSQDMARLQTKREALVAEMERVKRAYLRGLLDEAEADAEIPRVRSELQDVEERLALAGSTPDVIALQPATIARYRRSTANLIATLEDHARSRDGSRSSGSQAVADLRRLIETVTIIPDGPRLGFEVEVRGRLDELVRENPMYEVPERGERMVAREGFEPPTQGL